ncbi:MAG: peptide chain release factor N(5)-glutamine methyltransferase [Treponema sp.]|nr:peptide chain release factor N(5)-glutamine methyltransferase [Treponema sp.]
MKIQQAKLYGKKELTSSPTPELDTALLLQHITGFDRTHLLLNRDTELTAEQEEKFVSCIEKRKTGLPVAYITGHKEFFGRDFYVTQDVLIPKPDTELLVELALDALEDKFRSRPGIIPTVCDMCTGSGCVGISINAECRTRNAEIKLTLADISEKALAVAGKNAERILGTNYALICTNLFEQIPQSFDLIVTNPPYVPHSQAIDLLKDGRSEPLLALDGDVTSDGASSGTDDGLALIRRLVPQCYEHLNRNGVLIMETGEYNAEETAGLFRQAGFRDVRIECDMNEMLRDVIGVR